MKGGPVWSDVIARVTAGAVSGEILDSELAREFHSIGRRASRYSDGLNL